MKKRHLKVKAVLSMLLALLMIVGLQCTAYASSDWRTGNVPSNGDNTSAITITLSNMNKDAEIKVHGYASNGKEKKYRFHITMVDKYGNWIWEGDIKTGKRGKTLNLGNDHDVYVIYLSFDADPAVNPDAWNPYDSYSFPAYWGIECTSNCSVE